MKRQVLLGWVTIIAGILIGLVGFFYDPPGPRAIVSLSRLLIFFGVFLLALGILSLFRHRVKVLRKNIVTNLFLLCFVCFIGIFLLEGVSSMLLHSPCMTYKNCPNVNYNYSSTEYNMSVSLNNEGFRDTPYTSTRKADIAVIGDSIAFGWGVQGTQAFPQLIQRETGLRVLNLGIEGADPETYLKTLERYGNRADTIVLSYFTGNDIFLGEKRAVEYFTPINNACSLNFCILLYESIISRFGGDTRGEPNPLTNMDVSKINKAYVDLAMQWKINPFLIQDAINNPDLNARMAANIDAFEHVQRNKAVLDSFMKAAAGKKVIVLLVPQNIMVTGKAIDALSELGFHADNPGAIVCNPTLHDDITSFLSQYNVTVIDLQAEMCKQQTPERFYYMLDGHLTSEGHGFVADTIVARLLTDSNIDPNLLISHA